MTFRKNDRKSWERGLILLNAADYYYIEYTITLILQGGGSMKTGGISGFQPVLRTYGQTADIRQDDTSGEQAHMLKDNVSISTEGMERYMESISEKEEAEAEGGEEAEDIESESVGCSMGINAGKLARMLAAAKTRSQIRSVIALIESDIRECDSGKAQGADIDEASYKAAQQLLLQAESRMNSAEDREPTSEEEMAQAIASLM